MVAIGPLHNMPKIVVENNPGYRPHEHGIELMYRASIKGQNEYCEYGASPDMAVGTLIRVHGETIDISLENRVGDIPRLKPAREITAGHRPGRLKPVVSIK